MDEKESLSAERSGVQTTEERSEDYAVFDDGTRAGHATGADVNDTETRGLHATGDDAGGYREHVTRDERGYLNGGVVGVEPFPGQYAAGLKKPSTGPGSEVRDSNLAEGMEPSDKV